MSRKKKQILTRIAGLILLAALALPFNQYLTQQNEEEASVRTFSSGVVEVHLIDVGQGDSILIEAEDAAMLIDAGENNKGSVVVNYLQSQNIKELDYVIGTHPHSDHIGGLDTVIDSILVNSVIMPKVAHTTKTFEDVLSSLEHKNLKLTAPVVGKQYELGPATFTIIAPNSSEYDDLNDYSVGIKLTYGNNSFLFTGDATNISEKEMLSNGIDLSADVLKLGHHGSSTSSTKDFLNAVNPSYVMIGVGKDNEYGHPHVEIMGALKERNIKVYRTDVQGTVIFTSDGKNISVNTKYYEIADSDIEN